MNDLNSLQTRLEAALNRVSAACEALADRAAQPAGEDGQSAADTAPLEAEITRLRTELSSQADLRKKDLAELDSLIEQLKPLVEEV
ncbi:hypothetical protein [Algicella marina]|uniref:Uncharacterized protein n=1 Tax=Algicella marina TaxID=2683284 RepID=A0A6P1SYG5_9RHOB|nr:hypothetical protein [Algicella marina]QHQ34575.1 hypothetical protein GO499_04905 [Algicella marina]